MSARRVLTATTATLLGSLTLVGLASAASAGSDAPTPYRVTATGIELPTGVVFEVHGHVNVAYTSAQGPGLRNVHVEQPGTRFGDVAGTATLTWDRAGLPADACITWVQVGGFDEHYGEGGQAPVCRTGAVTDTPVPPAPSAPAPAPAAPATAPVVETPDVPSVPEPAPVADADVAPAPAPAAEQAAAPAPAAPTAPADERAEVLASDASAATPSPTPVPSTTAAERSEVLAATGARTGALLAGALLAVGLGVGLVVWRRRTTRP